MIVISHIKFHHNLLHPLEFQDFSFKRSFCFTYFRPFFSPFYCCLSFDKVKSYGENIVHILISIYPLFIMYLPLHIRLDGGRWWFEEKRGNIHVLALCEGHKRERFEIFLSFLLYLSRCWWWGYENFSCIAWKSTQK